MRQALSIKTLLGLTLVVALSPMTLAQEEDESIFKKPGSRERPNGEVRYNVEISHAVSSAIPEILECGEQYSFEVTAQEISAECKGYTAWDVLYREAVEQADGRVAQIRCPDECPIKNPWIQNQSAKCDEFDSPSVKLGYGVQCIGENDELIDGLSFHDPDNLDVPFDETYDDFVDPPEVTETLTSSLFPLPTALECPTTYNFAVDLTETISGTCATVTDYAPFVAKAQADATTLWLIAGCRPPCVKQELVETYLRWDCEDNPPGPSRVIIESRWSMDCK